MNEMIDVIVKVISSIVKLTGILILVIAIGILFGWITLPVFTQFVLILTLGILILLIKVEAPEDIK